MRLLTLLLILKPQYFSLGGLLIGNCLNLLGGWLYLYDERRGWNWRYWNRRRILGAAIAISGWCIAVVGYYLAAVTGGGY